MQGYIKLHRSLLDWEWYDDIPTTRLWIHLLLTVNIRDSLWHGVKVPKGSRVASIQTLAQEAGLTQKQIRGSLEKLERAGSVTRCKYPKFSLIAIPAWDQYQRERQATGQGKGRQPGATGATSGQQNKNIRKKEERNPLTPFLEQTDGPARFRKAYITDPETGERRVRILDDLD